MGALLGEKLQKGLASIGFTALRGESSMAGMP